MTDARPDPLVPAEVDLRDFAYMPVQCARLRKSKEWLLAKKDPAIGFYSFNLWTASWHERPPGSLEDDDDVLADSAMCPLARWKKVREKVLRKWVKCSDGRLYHPIVAEVALESWAAKLANRRRTDAATEARRQRDEQRNVERGSNVTSPLRSPREVKRSVREGNSNRDVEGTPTVGTGVIHNPKSAIEKIADPNPKNGGQHWDDATWVTATATTLGIRQRTNESPDAFRDRTYAAVQERMTQAQR